MTRPDLAFVQRGYRFNLCEPPTLQRLQRLFAELYDCSLFDPQYLFMNKDDHEVARQQIIEMTNIRCAPEHVEEHIKGIGYRMLNETTGTLLHIVPLPGLERNSVIVGFFS